MRRGTLLKNGIRAVYHAVGKDYLQEYVNEYTFRYNHRKDETPMFAAIKGRVARVRSRKQGLYAPVG
ncbi:MAG: transposase [Dehalococcoidia bacterium]